MSFIRLALAWIFIVFAGTLLGQGPNVTVVAYDAGSPPLRFAATEIRRALAAAGSAVVECSLNELASAPQGRTLVLAYGEAQIAQVRKTVEISPLKTQGQQSYSIRRAETMARDAYVVLGADVVGAMYGGLELAEAVRNGALKNIKDVEHSPYIARRGIKFNIPLDARTPSYSDNSDAAQQNIPEMWNFDFWREFLDEMARDRYNVLTLWNLHPFPSMVKVPEYPKVALADVMRTTIKMDDTYSHRGGDMVRPEILKNLETVRKMSIGEKIQFWRDVMQYAQDRGIEVYLFTWNIFTFGADGKYGITNAQTNQATIDYFRKSVRETVLTYPLLAGIGITAGEQMDARKDDFSKEKWLWKTYGEGIQDALKLQPQRQFRMIHRYHETGQAEVLSEWKNYPGPFDLSFKYAIAHMYSIPNPSFIEPVLPNLGPKLRSWLTVRNDDIYSFRWADAEYARAFVRNIPGPDKIAGFYMGPDGFIWGRDFLGTNGNTPRELVIKKQWYSFLLWGRLSYEPDLPDENLEQIVAYRFPEVPVKPLTAAWAHASRVFPLITRFSWGDIDLRWYPEASLSHAKFKGFYTVKSFMEGATMPGSGVLDIVTWRERRLNNTAMNGTTPLEIAAELKSNADSALPQLAQLRAMQGQNEELKATLGDIEAMSHLANYYAEKILAATDLALYDKTNDSGQQASAVRHLESALAHWKKYASAYSKQYKPQLLNRVGYVDIPALVTKVEEDIRIAKEWKSGSLTIDPKSRMRDNPFPP